MSSAADSSLWRRVKQWSPLLWVAIAALAAWVLWQRLHAIDFAAVLTELRSVSPNAIVAGLICSAGSYVLVGIYEGIAVRHASHRRAVLYPIVTAWIANPIGRVVGMAIVSGGALRYRLHSAAGLTPRQIGAVIVLAAMPYLLAVGWLLDLALLFRADEAARALRLATGVVVALGSIGLCKDIGWLVFVHRRREPLTIRQVRLHLPDLWATLLQIAFGVAQILLLATILFVFMPPELNMTFFGFVGIYLIAVAAGQLSNVPAGLGVIEAALLLMLPHVPPEKLLGAILAYRAVYELLPLFCGLLLLAAYELLSRAGKLQWWKAGR